MISFFELFERSARLKETWADPAWADGEFLSIVAQSPFRLWRPGDSVAEQGLRLLLGVATWSGYEMRLLDVIAAALRKEGPRGYSAEVFNTADCPNPQTFGKYIPGLGQVLHTFCNKILLDS